MVRLRNPNLSKLWRKRYAFMDDHLPYLFDGIDCRIPCWRTKFYARASALFFANGLIKKCLFAEYNKATSSEKICIAERFAYSLSRGYESRKYLSTECCVQYIDNMRYSVPYIPVRARPISATRHALYDKNLDYLLSGINFPTHGWIRKVGMNAAELVLRSGHTRSKRYAAYDTASCAEQKRLVKLLSKSLLCSMSIRSYFDTDKFLSALKAEFMKVPKL